MAKDRINITILSFLILLSVGIYLHALNFPFIYDDITSIFQNTLLHKIFNLKSIIFSGLRQIRVWQNISFAIDWAISGPKPWAFRITNLIFHLINALFIYNILKKLNYPVNKCYLLLGLFIASPLQLQSVHYAMGRVTILISFFYLWTLNEILKTDRSVFKICLIIISSFLAKEVGVLIPVLFLMMSLLKINEVKFGSKELFFYIATMPLYLIFYFILKDPYSMYDQVAGTNIFPIYRYLVTQGFFLFQYFEILLLPQNQSIIHEFPLWTYKVEVLGWLGIILASIFTAWALIYKRKNSVFIILFLMMALTIIPTNTFMQVLNPFAEYRFYLINLFALYLLVEILFWLFEKLKIQKMIPLVFSILGLNCLIFLYLNLQTFSRPGLAMNYALNLYPEFPQLNLVYAQMQGDQKSNIAEQYYQRAYDFYQRDPYPRRVLYIFSLARFRFNQRQYDECIKILTAGMDSLGEDQDVKKIYLDMLDEAKKLKQYDESIKRKN